ncbi:MAG: hypothetical protein DMF72_17055 [Acidobacteria bacterium]|nr:MAG: hypothetical protein DMF72_17055 [Acidobacteriota bacterium]
MAGKVIEYSIVSNRFADDTAREVNRLLAEGWELYGELKVVEYFATYEGDESPQSVSGYSQAMVRREMSEFMHAAGD